MTNCVRSIRCRYLFILALYFLFSAGVATPSARGEDLDNGTLRLKLGFNAARIPIIEQAEWVGTGEIVFTDSASTSDLGDWLPQDLIQPDATTEVVHDRQPPNPFAVQLEMGPDRRWLDHEP